MKRAPGRRPKLAGFCPKFHDAVELVGKRWTGAVLRLLLGGPHHFNEIASGVPGISARLLAQRLRELDERGIVDRHVDAGPPLRVSYRLTEAGEELEASIRALAHWAERWIAPRRAHVRRREMSRSL